MSRWGRLLDRLVAHERAPGESEPPFVKSLAVPYPDTWERGRVTSTWPVDERFFNERDVLFGGFLAVFRHIGSPRFILQTRHGWDPRD